MLVLFFLNVIGRLRRSLGALAGAVIVPIIGIAIFGFSLTLLFLLIPVGYPTDDCAVPDLARKPLDEILIRR